VTGRRAVLGFDTETTGTDMAEARIVAAAMVWRDGGGQVVRERSWLIDPGVPIPPEASAVHGITDVSAGQPPAVALAEMAAELTSGWPLVVFNAPYDLTVVDVELRRHGLEPLTGRRGPVWPVLDPLMIDWGLWPERAGRRTLAALCELHGCRPRARHDAAEDARAAIELWDRLREAAPDLGDWPAVRLAEFQRAAHQSWVAHLADAQAAHGHAPDAIPGWPFARL